MSILAEPKINLNPDEAVVLDIRPDIRMRLRSSVISLAPFLVLVISSVLISEFLSYLALLLLPVVLLLRVVSAFTVPVRRAVLTDRRLVHVPGGQRRRIREVQIDQVQSLAVDADGGVFGTLDVGLRDGRHQKIYRLPQVAEIHDAIADVVGLPSLVNVPRAAIVGSFMAKCATILVPWTLIAFYVELWMWPMIERFQDSSAGEILMGALGFNLASFTALYLIMFFIMMTFIIPLRRFLTPAQHAEFVTGRYSWMLFPGLRHLSQRSQKYI